MDSTNTCQPSTVTYQQSTNTCQHCTDSCQQSTSTHQRVPSRKQHDPNQITRGEWSFDPLPDEEDVTEVIEQMEALD